MPITYTRGDIIAQTTFASPNEPRKQIDELIEQAMLARVKLHDFMRELSRNINNESGKPIDYQSVSVSNKDKKRVAEKCGINLKSTDADKTGMKKPIEVKDIARATIVFSTIAQLLSFRDYIYMQPEFKALMNKQSPAVKDLWTTGVEDEYYKDVKFFLEMKIRYKGQIIPHIVELQLNLAQMVRGKKYGHAFYNLSRLASVDGKQRFSPADAKCKIVVPGNIKGKTGNKLRTALSQCRSIAQGNEEVLLAIGIMQKMMHKKLKMAEDMKTDDGKAGATESDAKTKAADKYDYVNGTQPLIIQCGPYEHKLAEKQDSGPAQAWAIGRLSSFIWSHFTACQNKPGVTGTAANIHDAKH